MFITLLIGLVFLAIAVALVMRSVLISRGRTVDALATIDVYGYQTAKPAAESERKGGRTVFDEVASKIGTLVTDRVGQGQKDEVRKALMSAGYYATPVRRFMGYRVFATVGLAFLFVWFMAGGNHSPLATVLVVPLAAVGGWYLPLTVVRRKARNRLDQIDRALPELIDLLIVTIEAGLAFSASLQEAADRLAGPLGDELRLTLQEQSMGLGTNQALKNLLLRADTPGMRSFVRSILQAETLGVSIGHIMRALASEMRKRRRAAAEERAQKAPVKILFPLVFLIFPALFIVILYPAIHSFITTFSGQ